MNDLIFVLAIWRICRLLMTDDGPFDIIARLRTHSGVYDLEVQPSPSGEWPEAMPKTQIGRLLTCIYCTSLWVSLFFVMGLIFANVPLRFPVARIFAYSGAAVLIDEYVLRLGRNERFVP